MPPRAQRNVEGTTNGLGLHNEIKGRADSLDEVTAAVEEGFFVKTNKHTIH